MDNKDKRELLIHYRHMIRGKLCVPGDIPSGVRLPQLPSGIMTSQVTPYPSSPSFQ